jgi:hypothetical protein
MILCPNGHENQDGATYCVVCKIYIDSTVVAPPPPPPPAPPPDETPAPPAVELTPELLTVAPGGEGVCDLRVETSGAADDYSVAVGGPLATWASVVPAEVSAVAGVPGVARVLVRVPAAAAPGTMPFEVTAVSQRDPALRASATGMLEVKAPEAPPPLVATLEPAVAEGRVSARGVVSVSNPASAPVQVRLSATESEGFLAFDIDPSELRIDPGGTASAEVRIRARRRSFVRGERSRRYQLLVVPEGRSTVGIDGTFVQRRYLPLVLVPVAGLLLVVVAVAALIVLAIIIAILYFWLVK